MLYNWFSEIAGQIGVLHDFTISDPIVVQTAKVFLSANGEGFSEGQDCEKCKKCHLNLVRENKKNCRTSKIRSHFFTRLWKLFLYVFSLRIEF